MTIIFRCVVPVCMAYGYALVSCATHVYAFTRLNVCVYVYVCMLALDFPHVYAPL